MLTREPKRATVTDGSWVAVLLNKYQEGLMRYVLFAVLSVLALSVSPLCASELFGKVTFKGAPLKNAEITIKDKKMKTNENGHYTVDLEPGAYELAIKLPNGSTRNEKVDVFPQDTEKNLKLE